MLKLRKILLCDYIYYLILLVAIIFSLINLTLPKKSKYTGKEKEVIGTVTKINTKDDKITIILKAKEKLIVTYYLKNTEELNISLGDEIKVYGIFNKPSINLNDQLFNYRVFLNRKRIFYIVKANSYKKISKNKNIYYYFKNMLIERLDNNPYLYTFILGDKSLLTTEIKRSYQYNGISHLFAISGMHITLLVNIIKRILKKLNLDELIVFKITTIILLIYLALVGLSPSILRGVLFYILFSLNSINYFYIKPQNLVFVTVAISLLINPYYIFDIAYLYSYSISFFLIILSKKISSSNYILTLFKTSIISFIVSLPITLYNFSEINLLSVTYNLFYVPLISLIVFPLSLIIVLIKPLEPIYYYFIIILEKTSLYFSNINILKITFKKLPLIIYLIYFLLIAIILLKNNKKAIVLFVALLIIHYEIPYIDNSAYLKVLNVNQGDSLILHVEHRTIMIDTGGEKSNYSAEAIFTNILNPSLKYQGIKRINYLILTHGDFDHMGEAINLVNNFKVEKVIFNCGEFNDLEKELIKVLDKKKITHYSCIKELNVDNNKLYFLQTKEYDNENDNSNVIYAELDGYKFMFMGDASITTEKEILDKYNLPDIDVLKVGHHGSRTSSSKDFIDEINPKYSIISVGKNNRYGHPNKEVLDNLKDSKIYRTDEDGSIMFKIKNNKLKIETCSP